MANVYQQYNFRVRDDTASINADSGWLANENVNPSARGTGTANRFRIRFTIGNNNSKTGTITPSLYVDKDGGGYNAVTASSSNVQVTGGVPADGAACSTQLLGAGAGTFETDGEYDEGDGQTAAWSHDKNGFCEVEFCVYIVDADVANNNVLTFHVQDTTTALDTYTNSPAITVSKAGGLGMPLVMHHRKQMAVN